MMRPTVTQGTKVGPTFRTPPPPRPSPQGHDPAAASETASIRPDSQAPGRRGCGAADPASPGSPPADPDDPAASGSSSRPGSGRCRPLGQSQPADSARSVEDPARHVPVGHTSTNRGHGRIETRTLKVVTVAALGSRSRTPPGAIPISPASTARSTTGRTRRRASAGNVARSSTRSAHCPPKMPTRRVGRLALRGHWAIEVRLHR